MPWSDIAGLGLGELSNLFGKSTPLPDYGIHSGQYT
jgi:hypothetical protein